MNPTKYTKKNQQQIPNSLICM